MPLGRKTPIGKCGWGSMLSVVDGGLTPIPWEDLDSSLVQTIQREIDGLTLGDLKDRLRPQGAIETIPGGDEYVVTNTNAPNSPCHVPVPDGVSECGLSELPSSSHSDDETEHDAFFVQTCVEEVQNAEYAAPLKPLLSMRVEDPVDEELDPRSSLREYVDSKRRLVAKKLCYAKPTRSSWSLKQGRMGDPSKLKEYLERKITTWQREVDLKLMKSVWGAHVRTPEEDDLSEECVCEPPRACLCCHRPPDMVERDLLYAYQGLKDTTKGEEFMQETMQYLGFDVGYGWWTPAASKAQPLMDAKVRHEDPKKGLHYVRSFIGACNFYRRHIKNFTYTSAILTDLIKMSTTWRWGPQEQQAFDELKDKVANAKCLGVPRAQGEIILVTYASNVGGWWNVVPMASTREGGVGLGYFPMGD